MKITRRKILAGFFLLTLPLLAASYTDNGDGTVTDSTTNLVWQQCSMGQNADATCTGTATTANWQAVLEYCENLTLDGRTDWRLPSLLELESIMDKDKSNPAIDITVFPATVAGYYWSSSTYVGYPASAWSVYFDSGYSYTYDKADNYYVRCVSSAP